MSQSNVAVVTGAGSGVGRSVTIKLVAAGWTVAALGRREAALRETAAANPGRITAHPCDVAAATAVDRAFADVRGRHGAINLLVNAAGTNVPGRSFERLSVADYRMIIETNLNGTFHCVQAVLGEMRTNGGGTIVNVLSDAGLWANGFSGPAYIASKFGQAGLTAAINAEERRHGIRACAVCPGEIDTPILDLRPEPPSPQRRGKMLKAEDVADCVVFVAQLPMHAVVEQLVVRPR
jgi:NAD(P)-dependent dehydrogenase (short-subunit alcohol dehydrogenase family)